MRKEDILRSAVDGLERIEDHLGLPGGVHAAIDAELLAFMAKNEPTRRDP